MDLKIVLVERIFPFFSPFAVNVEQSRLPGLVSRLG